MSPLSADILLNLVPKGVGKGWLGDGKSLGQLDNLTTVFCITVITLAIIDALFVILFLSFTENYHNI